MTALTLTPRALYEEVAELLRQRIFSGELEPGAWIDELKLAEEYGISRTPLREALKVLATEGLITMKVRRGAYVTEVSEKDLSDVYHLLSLLESDAAGAAALAATDGELSELETLHASLETAVSSREKYFELNEQFHMRLLAIANNRWRIQMVADLRKVMKLAIQIRANFRVAARAPRIGACLVGTGRKKCRFVHEAAFCERFERCGLNNDQESTAVFVLNPPWGLAATGPGVTRRRIAVFWCNFASGVLDARAAARAYFASRENIVYR
jgi:DNA-binding GntR family transcriptional regulator